jgi:hypothetical protein
MIEDLKSNANIERVQPNYIFRLPAHPKTKRSAKRFAALVTSNSATLNGGVNPNRVSTECFFEYGTDTSYGSTTAYMSVGSGTNPVPVSAVIRGLRANTYHFRIVAESSAGTSYGFDRTFSTAMPDKALPWLPLLLFDD